MNELLPYFVSRKMELNNQRGAMRRILYYYLTQYFLSLYPLYCYSDWWEFLRSSMSSCTPAQISQLSVWTPCWLPRWWSTQSAEIGRELQSNLFPRQHVLHFQPVIIRKPFEIIFVTTLILAHVQNKICYLNNISQSIRNINYSCIV
jgi:hypothetical protein